MDISSFSELLGYVSIACWLGAQFPQVIENYKRQSCQGLAWPFLVNWLLGDTSNLIGCLLTDQLPFQTWLATYFVLVDCSLVGQYLYYEGRRKSPAILTRGGRIPGSRAVSAERPRSSSRYRTLSAAAATAASRLSHSEVHGRHVPRTPRRLSTEYIVDQPVSPTSDIDDSVFDAALGDSVHSEPAHPRHQRRVSWSVERPDQSLSRSAMLSRTSIPSVLHLTSVETSDGQDPSHASERGRAVRRDVEVLPESTDLPRDGSTRKSRHSVQRNATVAFLGAGVLFTLGTLSGRQPMSGASLGHVISRSVDDTASTEKIIGRIFAWLCTTLYLTSRLPQIWKNFVRKSLEGLSMSLFLFAFLGNTFYVASILTSPKMFEQPPVSSDFLRESIPYLLGSAGTLMFDVTILSQSFIYRRPKRHYDSSIRTRLVEEEERSLLSGQV